MSRIAADLPNVCPHCGAARVDLLSFDDVCRRLRLSRRKAEQLLAAGKFPVAEMPRIGRRRFWSSVEVDDFIANETRRRLEESRAYTTQLRRVR